MIDPLLTRTADGYFQQTDMRNDRSLHLRPIVKSQLRKSKDIHFGPPFRHYYFLDLRVICRYQKFLFDFAHRIGINLLS